MPRSAPAFAPARERRACSTFPTRRPIIRFLDTRGLGEAGYDPGADIAFCEGRAHLILAVVKALDIEQQRAARRHPPGTAAPPGLAGRRRADEPARGLSAGSGHLLPYPFTDAAYGDALPEAAGEVRSTYQRTQFKTLPGSGALSFVPIDFTQPGDGFEPADYGREALVERADRRGAGRRCTRPRRASRRNRRGRGPRKADAHILGFAVAAGASDAVPVAGAIAVPMVQAAMLRQLAKLHGMQWDRRAYAEFLGALGAGTLVRTASTFGIRQLVKLVPGYGQTVGAAAAAAASFAATYAMGKAATYFLARRQQGRARRGGRRGLSRNLAERISSRQGARHRYRRRGRQAVKKQRRNLGYSRAVLLVVALLLPTAQPDSARRPLALAAGLRRLLGDRDLHRRDRPLLSADAPHRGPCARRPAPCPKTMRTRSTERPGRRVRPRPGTT